jgi:hypothetical protein
MMGVSTGTVSMVPHLDQIFMVAMPEIFMAAAVGVYRYGLLCEAVQLFEA